MCPLNNICVTIWISETNQTALHATDLVDVREMCTLSHTLLPRKMLLIRKASFLFVSLLVMYGILKLCSLLKAVLQAVKANSKKSSPLVEPLTIAKLSKHHPAARL